MLLSWLDTDDEFEYLTYSEQCIAEESSPAPQFEDINSSELSLVYGLVLTSIHGYWKNHSFDYMDLCYHLSLSCQQSREKAQL